MANIRIPFLVEKTNKAGVTTRYWQPSATLARAGWRPLAFGTDLQAAIDGARKRNEEVEAWKHGGARPGAVRRMVNQATLGALIDRYRREQLVNVAASTAKTYRTALARLDAWAGPHPLIAITPARVKALRDAMMAPEAKGGIGHYPAHTTLKMGRALFAFAIGCDLVRDNPFASFNLATPKPRDQVWSPAAREAMVAAADAASEPSMALAAMLGFAIGQREGDLLRMPISAWVAIPEHKMQPEDYATLSALAPDGVPRGIRIRQSKTGAWIEVPVVGEVRRRVEANIARAKSAGITTILFDDRMQRPWAGEAGQTRFQRRFAELRDVAAVQAPEIADVQFRDLRRTCVVYLGELGLDAHLIAAITGHDIDETQRILKTYMPTTTGRAARAIALSHARDAKAANDRGRAG